MPEDGNDDHDNRFIPFALAVGAGVAAALFLSLVGGWLIR
jgi:hypothetical protein